MNNLINRIFYLLKPVIPRKLQLELRRRMINSKRNSFTSTWPVYPGSETKPKNWRGWHGNKKFALILTHDVEHKKGYEKVSELMQIEKNLGFVSSFNFVPERDYSVEQSLLNKLNENGFEYGVHGLKHDGKLFSSKQEFLRRAEKINQYLIKWNSVGFRAPAMHHNLEWIGNLDILYDLSTFDTDPFEPQPDGVKTIFPFWVKNQKHKNGGYVELPYTLPQDFTVYILMREKTPELWINKTNWIANHEGRVLVNVHPDYINFENKWETEKFPVEIYQSFLTYISENFHNQFWNVLPKELGRFWQSNYQSEIISSMN